MKNFKTIIIGVLVIVICFCSTACSNININKLFDKGPDQIGYTTIESIEGIQFDVPTYLIDSVNTEEEILNIVLGNAFAGMFSGELNPDDLLNFTIQDNDTDSYSIMNLSKSWYMVSTSNEMNTKDAESVSDLGFDELNFEDGQTLRVGNTFKKEHNGSTTKIIVDVEIVFEQEYLSELGYNDDIVYSGYLCTIENECNFGASMLCVTRKDSEREAVYHCTQSLRFTKDEFEIFN